MELDLTGIIPMLLNKIEADCSLIPIPPIEGRSINIEITGIKIKKYRKLMSRDRDFAVK